MNLLKKQLSILLSHKDILEGGRGGGISTLYFELARELTKLGHRVAIIGGRTKSLKTKLFSYHYVPFNDYSNFRKAISDVILTTKPDIYECSVWRAEGLEYGKHKKRNSLFVVRGDLCSAQFRDNKAAKQEKKLMQSADVNIAVSKSCKKILEHLYKIKIERVIYNGVNTDIFKPLIKLQKLKQKTKEIIWVGRATQMKGFDVLQKIVQYAPPSFFFHIVIGESKEFLPLVFRNRNIKIYKNISLNHLINLYHRSNICLSTSRFEGFGLAVLEAMACGLPAIIPYNSGGLNEIVRNNQEGLYFHLENPKEAIYQMEAIKSFHIQNAVERAKEFSWQTVALQTIDLYKKHLSL